MTSEQFMSGIYQILYDQLKKSGLVVTLLLMATGFLVWFGLQQSEKYDKRIEKVEAVADTVRNDLIDCMVSRARLEERVFALESSRGKKLNNK